MDKSFKKNTTKVWLIVFPRVAVPVLLDLYPISFIYKDAVSGKIKFSSTKMWRIFIT